jgi:aspartate kinase
MQIIVQKFGGSSLSSISKIKKCAEIVKKSLNRYNNIIIVVSAMGDFTDDLTDYLKHFKCFPDESDVLLSSGEQISAGLFAIALNDICIKSCSIMSWQVPIITNDNHLSAKIKRINQENILEKLKNGYVVVIPGFQGISTDNKITTLGRGGSDITAVALASELKAEICEIYTDVDGVMRLDPAKFDDQDYLKTIGYQQLLEMSLGRDVLHTRAIDLAHKNKLSVRIESSFNIHNNSAGTEIKNDIENIFISGIIHKDNRILLISKKHSLFDLLNNQNVNPELIIHDVNQTKILIQEEDYKKLKNINDFEVIENLSMLHIVGSSELTNKDTILKIIKNLKDIKFEILTTTEIKIIIVVNQTLLEQVIETLLKIFNIEDSIYINNQERKLTGSA